MACDPAFADSIAPIGCELSDLGAPSAENCAGVASGADLGDALSIAKPVAAELFQTMAECLYDQAGEVRARPGSGIGAAEIDEAERAFLIARPCTIFCGVAKAEKQRGPLAAADPLGRSTQPPRCRSATLPL